MRAARPAIKEAGPPVKRQAAAPPSDAPREPAAGPRSGTGPAPASEAGEEADPGPPPEADSPRQAPPESPAEPTPAPTTAEDGGEYRPPGVRQGARRNAPPAYPPHARRRGLEGAVVLLVRVGKDGRPLQVAVAESSGHAVLDRAARRAVEAWTFRPARRGERKVAGEVKVPVRFRLRD